jgi:hypothetical protein
MRKNVSLQDLTPRAFPYFIVDRMYSNERRETREVLSAFLTGYRTGRLSQRKKDNS